MSWMTQDQRELARHALGLPNNARRSYRNHFVAGPGHEDYQDWLMMVGRGLAMGRANPPLLSGSSLFWLYRAGAELALNPGESLCPEDFPPVPDAEPVSGRSEATSPQTVNDRSRDTDQIPTHVTPEKQA